METVAFVAGALGLAYGVWSRYYLWLWAQECKGTRVAIAYKRRVKIDAPLTEWLLWARQASKDKDSPGPGRPVYSGGGTTVIIVRRVKARTVWKMKFNRLLAGRQGSPPVQTALAEPSETGGPS